MKLKTVSFKDSVKAFDGIFAAFGHFSPAFADRWPGILNRKPCSGSVAIDTEAKAGVGGDYYIFNASINQTLSVKEELRDEEFYYFNHYNRTAGNDHGVFGVASVLGCTKSVISSFEQVWVYGKYGADDSFTVDAQELTNAWKKLSDLSGYSQPASLSDLYKHGRFLDVGGSVEYFNLREVLRTYIAGLDEVKTEQDDYADPVTKREIVDFYVHLVMATLGHLP